MGLVHKLGAGQFGHAALAVVGAIVVLSLPAMSYRADYGASSYGDPAMYGEFIDKALGSVLTSNVFTELHAMEKRQTDYGYWKYFDQHIAPDVLEGCTSFSVFPHDFSLALNNPKIWKPNYILQTNLSCTNVLNAKLVSKYDEYGDGLCIFFHTGGYYPDNRSVILDNPDVFLHFAKEYTAQRRDYFVRFAKTVGKKADLSVLESFDIAVDREIALPRTPGKIFVSIALRPTIAGRALSVLYKLPIVNLVRTMGSGEIARTHFSPDIMVSPFIPNLIPETAEDVVAYFEHDKGADVASIRIDGPGLPYYENTIHVTLYRLESEQR